MVAVRKSSQDSRAITTLICLHPKYSLMVWDSYYKQNSQTLEKIQRKGARFVTGDYSYQHIVTTMLDDLNWPPLKQRRKAKRLTTFYKTANGSSPVTLPDYVKAPPAELDLLIGFTHRSRPTMNNIRSVSCHVPSENGMLYLLTWCTLSL